MATGYSDPWNCFSSFEEVDLIGIKEVSCDGGGTVHSTNPCEVACRSWGVTGAETRRHLSEEVPVHRGLVSPVNQVRELE